MARPTLFAPAARSSKERVTEQQAKVLASGSFGFINAVPQVFMVLNDQRQMVHANETLVKATGKPLEELLGKRPGEIFDCLYAGRAPDGCGTSEFCQVCGAAQVILNSLDGRNDQKDCRLLREADGRVDALDLLVTATPLVLEGHHYSMFAILDVSHEKRRRALERTFFHDILNRAGGLRGILHILAEQAEGPLKDDLDTVAGHFRAMVDEIIAHKELMEAENLELTPCPGELSACEVMRQVADAYRAHPLAEDRTLEIVEPAADIEFTSDKRLLGRVLGNLVKNALEATPANGLVTMTASAEQDKVKFSVHNPGHMQQKVQLEVFKRSFSTKGADRGLGTFSVKLITERYLGGQTDFSSKPEEGTLFWVRLPLAITDSDAEQSANLVPRPASD